MLVLFVPVIQSYGQNRVFADKIIESQRVADDAKTVDRDLTTYGRLKAIGKLDSAKGILTLGFEKPVMANRSVLIKVNDNSNSLLKSLLGGTLGGLLDGVLGGLLGNQEFIVELLDDNGEVVLSQSSTVLFNSNRLKVIQNNEKDFSLLVYSDKEYKSVRITTINHGLLPLISAHLDVYGVYYDKNDLGNCGRPIGTSFDAIGIDVSLLKGVTSNGYHLAIDGNADTYSKLKAGGILALGVGQSLSQYFYFSTKSSAKSTFNITIGANKGVLDLKVISGLEVRAYNGTTEVYKRGLNGGLLNGVDLLSLLHSKEKSVLTFAPGKAFDRVELRLSSTLDVGLLNDGLRIYDIERFDGETCDNPNVTIPTPTHVPFEEAECATSLVDFQNVDFPTNAIDGNNESYAILYAKAGELLAGNYASGMIHMAYDKAVPANTTSYIRIDMEEEVLARLLKGTLGQLLDGVLGAILGNHAFEVEAYDGSTLVSSTTSANGFSTTKGGTMKIVQDNIGRYYIAVTPDKAYNSIKIKNKVTSIPNGETRIMKVFNMCREIGNDPCSTPQFTSYDQEGISLAVKELGNAGVINPYHAISDNSSEYSEIGLGLLSVAGTVKQIIYFGKPSQKDDVLKVRLQMNPSSLVKVDLLGNYKVVTYLGKEKQESFTLQQGLLNGLDLLNLFKSGGIQTLNFDTQKVFDRVEIQVQSLLDVSVNENIRLYDVRRVNAACPEEQGVSPFITPVCASEVLASSNANDISNAVDGVFNSYTTLNSGSGLLLGLGQKEGFIELGYNNAVKANTTSYVRIDFEESALKSLLGGSLGNLVTGLVDGLLLGNHFFKVEVKDTNGKTILEEGSQALQSSFKEGKIRVVIDKAGRTYLAITPTKEYKSIRITDVSKALVGATAKPNSMNVYGMCYETGSDACVSAFATSYEFEGVNLSINDLGKAGVTNPEWAINGNTTNGSGLNLGTLAVGSSVKQWIYFNTLSLADDITNIRLKVGKGGLTVPLLETLEIIAYNGEEKVSTLNWKNLVEGIDLLGLIGSGEVVNIPFKSEAKYDRISVGIKNVLNVGVFPPVELYAVERMCKPVGSKQNTVAWKSYKINNDSSIASVRGGEEIEYTIHVNNTSDKALSYFVIEDKIPAGTTFVSAENGTFDKQTDKVVFTFNGKLNALDVKTFSFKVKVNSNLTGLIEIKNIALVKEEPKSNPKEEVWYPSYPPVDNLDPIKADVTKAPGTIIPIVNDCIVDKATITSKNVDGSICIGSEIILEATVPSGITPDTYQWYLDGVAISSDDPEKPIGTEKTLTTDTKGNYTVKYTAGKCVSTVSDVYTVVEKDAVTLVIEGSQRVSVKIDSNIGKAVLQLPNVQTNGSTPKWFDQNSAPVAGNTVEFNAVGNYTLTVVSELDGCETYESLIVTVFDDSLCPPTIERVYARGGRTSDGTDMNTTWYTTLAGFVANKEKAVDGDPTTHSTISSTVALLGLGTTWQNIYFDHAVKAGTPLTIKLGKEYSGLVVAGGLSVVGLDKKGKRIGTIKPVAGGLLDLLTADNVLEYTFVPSDKKGPQEYYGVQISVGALVGVAQLAKVYGVYYDKPVDVFPAGYCEPVSEGVHPAVLDVLHGVQDLGLGVASATASVVNPWNAVNEDPTKHATISRGVAVLNAATLTVVFKQQAMPGDELHIITEVPGNPILSLELIKGYTIQRYLGDKKVGPEIDGTGGVKVIDLKLLGLGYKNKYKMIIKEVDEPFDRVKISYGNVVGVLGNFTKIYEVSVAPKMNLGDGFDINNDTKEICEQGNLVVTAADVCTSYKMFTTSWDSDPKNPEKPIEGVLDVITNKDKQLVNQYTFRLPKDLEEYEELDDEGYGTGVFYKVVYVQTYRNGCLVGKRIPVKLNTKNCSVKSNLNITHKIK